jgi:hypothetical protein
VDPRNDEETKKTRNYLYARTADKAGFAEFAEGFIHVWGGLVFTEAQKAEIDNYPGIRGPLEEEPEVRRCVVEGRGESRIL